MTQPAQETLSGHEGLGKTMPATSLQGRAKKAAHDKLYRFRHLFGMLTITSLCSAALAAPEQACGIWGRPHSARAYGERLHDRVTSLVERVKTQCYRATLVRRHSIPRPGRPPAGASPPQRTNSSRRRSRGYWTLSMSKIFLPAASSRKKIGAQDAVRPHTSPAIWPVWLCGGSGHQGYFDPAS